MLDDPADPLRLSGDFTIEMWVRSHMGDPSGTRTIMEKGTLGDLGAFELGVTTQEGLVFNRENKTIGPGVGLGDDWQHLAVTYDDTADELTWYLGVWSSWIVGRRLHLWTSPRTGLR